MVILFTNRNNKTEKEIIEILTACGADFFSERSVTSSGGFFTFCSLYKPAKLDIKKGTVLILDDTEKFNNLDLENGITGICEDSNITALNVFEKNSVPVITVGNNPKNTITLSSCRADSIIITLQRSIKTVYGNEIYPGDYKVNLTKSFSSNAILLAFAILVRKGILPEII